MKLSVNNRDERLSLIESWIKDNNYTDTKDLILKYSEEIFSQKCSKQGTDTKVKHRYLSKSYRKLMVDCLERSMGSVALLLHKNKQSTTLGYFYIIGCKSFPNYYKLGYSKDAETRLNNYQTYSPFRDFYLCKYLIVFNAKLCEDIAKEYFKERLLNEWFYSENIDKDFKDLAKVFFYKN